MSLPLFPTFLAFDKSALKARGFTILEVLITAAIIGVITAIVTFKYGSFNNLILLKNQSYQVAIDLRETQTKSLSVAGANSTFRKPYGIYFATATPDQYTLFLDSNSNGLYDVGEELEVRRLDSRFMLSGLCSGASCNLDTLAVTFRRPNFDAIMNNGAVTDGSIEISTVSGSGTRTVNINAAGQITVE